MSKKIDEQHVYAYIRENQAQFYRVAYSYTKRKEDALDVIQEASYKAMYRLHTLKNPDYLKTWFYRILINCCVDWTRKNKRIVYIGDDYLKEQVAQTNSNTYLELYEALEVLDDNQRIIIILRFFEDMKIDDIAKTLDCNVSTIKTRLYAALKKLKIELEEE
ncbi:MAG: sigma-70 family RNA polymerase sigma factor [Bacillaceae bacterium]